MDDNAEIEESGCSRGLQVVYLLANYFCMFQTRPFTRKQESSGKLF